MTEFLLKKKVYLINKAKACPEEHRVQSQDRPGCPILAAHIAKVGAKYEKKKKEKREALDRKLRESVNAAQK